MSTLTIKFGGTSIGSSQAMAQAASIVLEQSQRWDRLVTVVSAMSGVTDQLIRGALTASSGDDRTYREIVTELRVRHYTTVDTLLRSEEGAGTGAGGAARGNERADLLGTVDEYLNEFAAFCHSVGVLGEVTPRAMDAVTSMGERISARILAALLQRRGARSEAVDATDLIVTDDTFQDAAPLIEATRERVASRLGPLLDAGVLPIVTGFIGATQQGVTTTLGRGGSDFSAAILADCLDADQVWIWTDVDGVMTADPGIVREARVIPLLSYSEVSELAYYGAKVLHPRTIRPIIERGIPLWVKNTFNPTFAGTRVVREPESTPGTVKAVTAIKGLSLVTVEGRGMLGVPGIAARTFSAVASQGASVLMISQSSSEQSICFVLPTAAVPPVIRAIEQELALELQRRDVDRVSAVDDVVIVTAVGAGIRGTPGVAQRIFGALGQSDINVIAIAQGSSECSVSLVVEAGAAAEAVQQIHRQVIANSQPWS